MKNILKHFLLFVFTALVISCNTDESISNLEQNERANLLKYRTLFKSDKPDGSIVLQSNATGTGMNTHNRITMSRKGDDKNKKLEIRNHNRSLIGFKNHEHNESLSNLFGEVVTLKFSENGTKNPIDSLYIPEQIIVDYSSNLLEAGTTINWNADAQNTNGVVITISYDPLLQMNFIVGWENQFRINESFALDEGNGSYTVTQQNLDRFPQDAEISIKLTRGAYSITENEPIFIAFSMVSNNLKVKK